MQSVSAGRQPLQAGLWLGGAPPAGGPPAAPPRPPLCPPGIAPPLWKPRPPLFIIICITESIWAIGLLFPLMPTWPMPGLFLRLSITVIYLPLKRESLCIFAFMTDSFDTNSMKA